MAKEDVVTSKELAISLVGAHEREVSVIGLKPVRRFFPHSNLSQTTIVRAQDKSQRAFHEIFSKLVSTFSALVHLDCESPEVPCFCGSWRVRCAIRRFWHNLPPFKVIGKITIYHFYGAFASKSHLLLAVRARHRKAWQKIHGTRFAGPSIQTRYY